MNGREQVLGYQAFRDLSTGIDELLVFVPGGRFVVESCLPCERAIDDGRLYTDGVSFYLWHRERFRKV